VNRPTPEQIKAWTDRADQDLRIARGNLEMGFYDACAVFCQQSVEKYLKALHMATMGREAPRTHQLVSLAMQLRLPEETAASLHLLEADYMAARYPDVGVALGEDYTEEAARERLAVADEALAWIRTRLAETGVGNDDRA
jgi:HEPN domain-containing protein